MSAVLDKLSRLAAEANSLPQANPAQVAHINELTAQIAQEYAKTAGMDLSLMRAGADNLVLGRRRRSPLISFGKAVLERIFADSTAAGISTLLPRAGEWIEDIGIGPDERAREEGQSRQGENADELCRAVDECCSAIEEITSTSDSSANILLDLILTPLLLARVHPALGVVALILELVTEGLDQIKATTQDRNNAIEACLAECTDRCNTAREHQPAPEAQFDCPPAEPAPPRLVEKDCGDAAAPTPPTPVKPAPTQPAAAPPAPAPAPVEPPPPLPAAAECDTAPAETPKSRETCPPPAQAEDLYTTPASAVPPLPPVEPQLPGGNINVNINIDADLGGVPQVPPPCDIVAPEIPAPEPLSPDDAATAIAVAGAIGAIGAATVIGGLDALMQCVEVPETECPPPCEPEPDCPEPEPEPECPEPEPEPEPKPEQPEGPPLAEGTLPPPPELAEVAQPEPPAEKVAMYAPTEPAQQAPPEPQPEPEPAPEPPAAPEQPDEPVKPEGPGSGVRIKKTGEW